MVGRGAGVLLVSLWGSIAAWWPTQEDQVQVAAVGGAAVVSAALIISIGYLIASDVRGRSSVATATVHARAHLATTMIQAAQNVWRQAPRVPSDTASLPPLVPLSSGVPARNHHVPAADQDNWLAVAVERHPDGGMKFLFVKGTEQQLLGPDGIYLNP
jgi:hypothetical protein